MKVQVTLNGTDVNPYKQYGLECNPFPRIARYEFAKANKILADLAANPIKDVDDLRKRLVGCTPEFIEGCVARFQPGKMVHFEISWKD